MNKRMLSCLSGLLLSFASAAAAQEARPLTEQEVVAVAVANNPSLHVALLRAQQSRFGLRAEEALYTPILGASAGYTHSRVPSLYQDGTRITGSDVFDVGLGLTKPFAYGTVLSATMSGQRSSRASLEQQALLGATGPGYSLVGRLAATQPLLRGAGTDVGLASLRQARLNLSANELAAQAAASQVLSQVVSDYWELWYSNEAVRINEASRELARVQQEQAQQQVQSGALAPASALPYATQVAQLDEAVLAARTDVRQRELVLAQTLGRAAGVGEALAAVDVPQPPSADEPVEATAVREALANSYERRQLQAQLAIARDQLKISGDPLRPRLDLDAYVQAQGLGNRRVPPAIEQFGQMEAVSAHVGLTFEMPVTDARRSAQIQAAQLAARVAEKQIAVSELAIRSSVASAIAQRRAARERLELATQTEKVAKAQAEAERARFLAGGTIAITVQQAEDSYRQAQLRVQRARVDLVMADLSLAELRGQLLTRYADAVQRLPAEQRITLSNNVSGNF
ncbi:MAG: TolC family protein [Myxococcales bacterium]|nr:MAG: TolC family protein [Myxococcales bacterium]